MKYYSFHRKTGEFIKARTPQRDPLESESAGFDIFVQPGIFECTEPPPKTKKNQVAVWVDNAWQIVADHRGEDWWIDHEQKECINTIGDPVSMGFAKKRPTPLPTNTNINVERDSRLEVGVRWNGRMFEADMVSVSAITAIQADAMAALMQNAETKETFTYFGVDNEPIELSAKDVLALHKVITRFSTQIRLAARRMKNQTERPANISQNKHWR